jgi:YgiT-type zinc finger domain-containing protein
MRCEICGAESARVRRVTRSLGRGKSAFLVENVPVVTCSQCGESYLTAETLQELERMRLHSRELIRHKTMPVARYAKSA